MLPPYSTSSACRSVVAESAEKTPAQPSRAGASVSRVSSRLPRRLRRRACAATLPYRRCVPGRESRSLIPAGAGPLRHLPCPWRRRPGSCLPAWLRQELSEGRVEAFGVLEVREVACAGEGHVAGVRYLLGHRAHDLGGGDPILLPTDDQRGDLYLAEERGRVRAIAHGAQSRDDAVGGALEDHGADLLHDLLVVLQGVGGEEAFQLQLYEDLDPLLGDAAGHFLAVLAHLFGVRLWAGVGEDEAGYSLRKVAQAPEGDVAAHRDAAKDHVLELQAVEESADRFGIVAHVGLGWGARGPPEARVVG